MVYGVRKRDGSGKGVGANRGRNPVCNGGTGKNRRNL